MRHLSLFLIFLSSSTLAFSSQYRIDFGGTISTLGDPFGYTSYMEGDYVTGSILINLADMPADMSGLPGQGNYASVLDGSDSLDWIHSSIDGLNTPPMRYIYPEGTQLNQVLVQNDSLAGYDYIRINDRAYAGVGQSFCGTGNVYCSVFNYDFNLGNALTSDSFPVVFSDSDLTAGSLLFKYFSNEANQPAINLQGRIAIENVSVTPVPLPAAFWLFAAGLFSLRLMSRK